MFEKNDIFYKTRIRIIMISNLIVFLCLFVFVILFQAIYSSNIYKDIDNALMNRNYYLQQELIRSNIIDKSHSKLDIRYIFNEKIDSNLITIIYDNEMPIMITPNFYFDIYDVEPNKIKNTNSIENVKINSFSFRGIQYEYNQYKIEILANVDYQMQSIDNMKNSVYMALIVLLGISILLSKVLAQKAIVPIKNAYDKQIYFVQDASHEMRTPLAVIKGKLELLSRDIKHEDSNFEYISKMMSEIRGLEKLNKDLLLLSKEDIGFEVNIQSLNLNDFIDDISDFYIDLADIQNKEFEIIKSNVDIEVLWDVEKIKRSIVILLENAFKYTSERDRITLEVVNSHKKVVIKVIDTGIGIKSENQDRIFDRFYRGDDVRAQNLSGSGIGLSLLKTIALTLNIRIDLISEFGKGSEFILTIPKKM